MGQEIFYCSKCLRRLTTGDCEKGLGVRVGTQACCTECLPQLVSSLTAEEQREFAKELAAQKKAVRADLKRGSSAAVPFVSAAASPHPTRRKSPWPLVLSLAGAGSAVVFGIILLLPRRPEPAAPAPAPPAKAAEDGRTRAARDALEKARKTRGDLEVQIAAWANAARLAQGTPLQKEAVETHQALLEERQAVRSREAADLETQAKPLLEREEFGAAAEHFERARSRRDAPEWKALMDAKVRVVRARAEALFAELLEKSAEARRRGKEDDVQAVRERVSRWGRPDLAAELERRLAAVAPAERAWKAIFDGKSLDFLTRQSRPGWEVRDGALTQVVKNAGQTVAEFGDGELRVRFEAKDVDIVYFTVRKSPSEGFTLNWSTAAFRAFEGKTCEILFTCRGNSVTANLNGQAVPVQATGRPLKGILQFNAQAKLFRIFSIEFRDLP